MHAIGAMVECGLPVVVDEQPGGRATHGCHRSAHLGVDVGRLIGLEAQLHGGHTGLGHTRHPMGVGEHGVQAQLLRARRKGRGVLLQLKVFRINRPLRCREGARVMGACLPGARQTFRIGGDETHSGAGRAGCQVHRLQCAQSLQCRQRRRVEACEIRLVRREDGGFHGVGVWGVHRLSSGARKGCPARECWAGRAPVRPWRQHGVRLCPLGWLWQKQTPWPPGLAPMPRRC